MACSSFLSALGRKILVVNLDPANDSLPYQCGVNITELVTLGQAMLKYELGPNGALVFCMEYLEKNFDWLRDNLKQFKEHYVLFDCPGQVELYTHHNSTRNIIKLIEKENIRLTCVNLIDSYYCSTPSNYVAAVLTSLSAMLHLELPHVNVLSKIDLIQKFGNLDFGLEFYTDVEDLSLIEDVLDRDQVTSKFKELNRALCEIIQDFRLVNFCTLNIQDKESVAKLVKEIDRANGYAYTGTLQVASELRKLNVRDVDYEYYRVAAVQEKYILGDGETENLASKEDQQ